MPVKSTTHHITSYAYSKTRPMTEPHGPTSTEFTPYSTD